MMHACVFMSAKLGLMVMQLSRLVVAGHLISWLGLKLTAEWLKTIPSLSAHCLAEAHGGSPCPTRPSAPLEQPAFPLYACYLVYMVIKVTKCLHSL